MGTRMAANMIMEDIIASVEDFQFDIEIALLNQIGIQPLPFPGMDKSGSAICNFYISTGCHRGQLCPLRHISGDRSIVCKHWLRGLCKKGDECEFLHQYDMEKMPECYFFNKYGQCSNKECPFLHLTADAKIKECPWYDRGFCKHGPHCKNRHVRRVMCVNFMCGFCPLGKKCKYTHPSHDVPVYEDKRLQSHIICHACGEPGHKSTSCAVARRLAAEAVLRGDVVQMPDNPVVVQEQPAITSQPSTEHSAAHENVGGDISNPAAYIPFGKRPLEFVTCFKCRGKGHYANKCPFGQNAHAGLPKLPGQQGQQQPQTNMDRAVQQHMQHMVRTGVNASQELSQLEQSQNAMNNNRVNLISAVS